MEDSAQQIQPLLEWQFRDYEPADRKNSWYVWYGAAAAILIGIAIFSDNYLFATILILFSLILFLQNWQRPRMVTFRVTGQGIQIDGSKFAMRDITEFWIAYDPPHVEKVYFVFENPLRPAIGIPLMGNNPLQVREVLLQYLPENLDREEETTSDAIGRVLKI